MTLEEAWARLQGEVAKVRDGYIHVDQPDPVGAAKAAMLAVLKECRAYSSAHSKAYDRIKERIEALG